MKCGVVITLHGHYERLGSPCLSGVLLHTPRPRKVVVFDNQSPEPIPPDLDEDVVWLRINDQEDLGYLTGSWNLGVEICNRFLCDRVVLLNQDTLVGHSWPALFHSMDDHRKDPLCAYGPVTNKPGPMSYHRQLANQAGEGVIRADRLNGFCFGAMMSVFMQNTFDGLHYFDPRKRFAGNEDEWCDRLRGKGGRFYVVRSCYVHHHKDGEWRRKGLR